MKPIQWGSFLLALPRALGSDHFKVPATVELDLIFPKNETYEPSAILPLVFGLQNPSGANALDLDFQYYMYPFGGNRSDGFTNLNAIDTSVNQIDLNSTSSTLLYYHELLFNQEGIWVFDYDVYAAWYTMMANGGMVSNDSFVQHSITFTTKKGGKAVDLAASTKSNACKTAQSQTWSITNVSMDTGDIYPELGVSPDPAPCNIQIDSKTATSIKAAIHNDVCNRMSAPGACETNLASKAGGSLRLTTWSSFAVVFVALVAG
ncbi:hypothetical protein KEM56_002195 [Ascosphaera pollenicola]|nr:hypothetical protein KEM56_002195 [Ascosphaera pollenicola]